jgi:hypothetical protein
VNEQSAIPNLENAADADFESKGRIRRFAAWFKNKFFGGFREKVANLNVSQWFYFAALILLINNLGEELEDDAALVWVGIIAGIGLARELWHIFNRLWENMLGKALIFVLYAATANIAIAVAALKVNEITGIEPTPFVFTIGFTTLLMLPFWLMVTSIVFFSVTLLATNLWLIISLFLRLVRVKVKVHWEDKSFVFLTMLLRVILIPIVLGTIAHSAAMFADQIRVFDNPITNFGSKIARLSQQNDEPPRQEIATVERRGMTFSLTMPGENEASANTDLGDEHVLDEAVTPESLPEEASLPNQEQAQEQEPGHSNSELNTNEVDTVEISDEDTMDPAENSEEGQYKIRLLDALIANFIFYFETYPYSKCEKEPHQRSLPIDENLIMLAEEDDSAYGYKFIVRECEGRKSTQIVELTDAN